MLTTQVLSRVWSSLLSCSVRRKKAADKPILPTIHVAAPSPVLSASDKVVVISKSTSLPDNATWRSSWHADKARFMERPNLMLGELQNSKQHQRSRSRCTSTPSNLEAGSIIPLEVNVSSPGRPGTPEGNNDPNPDAAKKSRLNPFGSRKPPNATTTTTQHSDLLRSGRCYRPNPLSAVSGNLYDDNAAPAVVLRTVPIPQPRSRATLELAPYPDLFDFSAYDKRASSVRRSDLVVPRSLGLGDKENDCPANARSSWSSSVPCEDFTKADPSAYVSSGVGILSPPASSSSTGKRIGVPTAAAAAMFFGTASILDGSAGTGTGASAADNEDASHDLVEVLLHEE